METTSPAERISAWEAWIEDGAPGASQPSVAPEVVNLLSTLWAAGFLEDVIRMGQAYVEIDQGFFSQRPSYLAARAAVDLGRWQLADGILARLEGWQGLDHGELGAWEFNYVLERVYASIARADLERARGRLDGATAALAEGRRRLADAQELLDRRTPSHPKARRPGERDFRIADVELRLVGLDLDLANGDYRRVVARADDLVVEARSAKLGGATHRFVRGAERRKNAALQVLALADERYREAALSALTEELEAEGTGPGERFEAHLRRSMLRLAAGDVTGATEDLDLLEALASTTQERALAVSQRAFCALRGGVGNLAEIDRRWSEIWDELLDPWLDEPALEAGSGMLQFGERRTILVAGLELAAARYPNDPRVALARYLDIERLSSMVRRAGMPRPEVDRLLGRVTTEDEATWIPVQSPFASRLFCIVGDRVQHVALPGTAATRDDQHELLRMLRGVGFSADGGGAARERAREFERLGDRLGSALVPNGVRAALRDVERITLVEAGIGAPIPLQLLRVDGVELGLGFGLARVPSLTVETFLVERHFAADGGLTLVADVPAGDASEAPDGSTPDPIALTDVRLRALTAPFATNARRILRGADATEEALCAGAATEGTTVLTVVAHGIEDPNAVRPPALWVGTAGSGDGLWGCDEVESTPQPPVVILASCRSAGGLKRFGDTYSADLGGAFLLGGARAVVLARGDLPFDATLRMVEAMHASLARGATVAGALRDAARSVAGTPAYGDPYAYGQFEILGDGGFRPFPDGRASDGVAEGDRRRAVGGALLGAGALLGLVLLLRRSHGRDEHTR